MKPLLLLASCLLAACAAPRVAESSLAEFSVATPTGAALSLGAATADPRRGEGGPGASDARARAAAGFARLASLQGEWIGRSSEGWEERLRFDTIAGGSTIVETSFDAHPGERMLTTFVLDGERLLLTHYCIAGNQPRLLATDIRDEGRTLDFTFLDATGLPSRDAGHMDRCVLRLIDEDHFTSQWTWYQDGQERWMEEITCERVPASGPR